MTDKERFINMARANGLEVSVIGNTVQWTQKLTKKTRINWFDDNGKFIKAETWG